MKCSRVQDQLAEQLTRPAGADHHAGVETHLANCVICRQVLAELQQGWALLDNLEMPRPGSSLKTRTVSAVAQTMAAESAQGIIPKFFGQRGQALVFPLVFGLFSALISLLLLHLSPVKIPDMAPATAIIFLFWIALYSEVFRWLNPSARQPGAVGQWIARASLLAMSLFLTFTFLQPVPSCVAMCETASDSFMGSGVWLKRNAFCLFGMLYAFLPTLFATLFSRARTMIRPVIHGSAAGLAFLLISAPGIILQCPEWTAGIILSWTIGALLGSVGGGTIGTLVKVRSGLSMS